MLLAGAGISHSASKAQQNPPEPSGPASITNADIGLDRYDVSGHKARFVTVEPGVQLEVLDWGGSGEFLVLLAGLGDNAHVFDQFAYQFTDRFHVVGVTRRGFGRSSQPESGYDVDTRARDDVQVLDALNIRSAVFVGHSISGSELSKLGEAYPDRVQKLVYLDGLDNASGGWANLAQPPPAPEPTAADLESVHRLAAAWARSDGYRKPLSAIAHFVRTSPSGKVVDSITHQEITRKIYGGLQPAKYERIRAPVLGVFNAMSPQYRLSYYCDLDRASRREFDLSAKRLSEWTVGAIERFRSAVKNSRVVELPDANHYAFITEESRVVREIRKFLLED
jgi:non-heme chloroperoxidase